MFGAFKYPLQLF